MCLAAYVFSTRLTKYTTSEYAVPGSCRAEAAIIGVASHPGGSCRRETDRARE